MLCDTLLVPAVLDRLHYQRSHTQCGVVELEAEIPLAYADGADIAMCVIVLEPRCRNMVVGAIVLLSDD